MEQQVTVPIERALNSVPSVIARRSRTIFGLSVVELTFAYGTDDYFARQVVLEELRDAEIPDGVTPTLGPLATPIGELYRYVVEGEGYDDIELRELEDWVVEPRFRQVSGVADVTPFGGLVKQYQIEIDPRALEKYNLSIGQIAQAVSANNQNAGGAMLDNGQQSMVIRGVGLIQGTRDIGEHRGLGSQGRARLRPRPGQGEDRRGASPPASSAWTKARRRRGHRADAPRREPQRSAPGHPRGGRGHQRQPPAAGRAHLRPSTTARTW